MKKHDLICLMAAILHAPRIADQGIQASEELSAGVACDLYREVLTRIKEEAIL